MKRILANMSNGFCGCDEEFILSFDDSASENEIWDTMLESYTYTNGFAGDDYCEEDAIEDGYGSLEEYWEAQIGDYSSYRELSEEEYQEYIEEGIEER